MKIICISTSIIPAPTAHSMQLMKVCQALVQLGHHVELVVPGRAGEEWEALAKHYGLAHSFIINHMNSRPVFRRYDFSLSAVYHARRQKPDLVYSWLLPAAVMTLWAGIPTILELHDRITGRAAPWWFRHFINSHTQKRLVVITKALENKIGAQFPGYRGMTDLVIAPNGVELERYTELPSAPMARKQLALSEKLTVVYTGGFYAGRGIELLKRLAGQNPGIQFIWAGGSSDSVNVWKRKISEEGLSNILLTGFIDNTDLPLYQAAADILVMPFGKVIAGSSGGNSADICSPMKMFDYLAAGRAIMASDLPVLHEVLTNTNAVLLPPEDQDAWNLALKQLTGNRDLRESLGGQARKDASRYTWMKREDAILKGFPG